MFTKLIVIAGIVTAFWLLRRYGVLDQLVAMVTGRKKNGKEGVKPTGKNSFRWAHVLRWIIMAGAGVYITTLCLIGQCDVRVGLFKTVVIGLILWWIVPVIVRQMANQMIFFLRVPEMTAAVVMKDLKAHTLIVSVSGEFCEDYDKLKVMLETQGIRVVIINPQHPLVWIGMPWIYTVHSFYERTADEVNPITDPVTFLDLNERTYNFSPPPVDTGDPIQVVAKLVASMIPWNPLKMIFSVRYYMEAFSAEMDARWRRVAATLHFFVSDPVPKQSDQEDTPEEEIHGRSEQLEFDPEIYINAHRRLLIDTWLFGRYVEYKLHYNKDDLTLDDHQERVPRARWIEKEPEAVEWNIRDPQVRLGIVEFPEDPKDTSEDRKMIPWDVYGDYLGNFIYVRKEDDKFIFRNGDGEKIPGDSGGVAWGVDAAGKHIRKLQVKPQRRVCFDFHFSEGAWRGPKTYFKYGIPKDKAARRFYENWGLVLVDIEMQDIDPEDPNIRRAIQQPLIARASAIGEIETAKGKKRSLIIEGEGVMQRRVLEGEGEKKYRWLAHEGDAQGFKAKMKALGIKPGEDAALATLIADSMQRVASETEMLVMSGSQGGWTDLFGSVPALQKLWSGGKPPSQSEIVKVLRNLSSEDLASTLEALGTKGEGSG